MSPNAIAFFEKLNKEKAAFDRATQEADKARARVETRLQEFRKRKDALGQESRKLSDMVGQYDNRMKAYSAEKSRVEHVTRQERTSLGQCANDTEALLEQGRARKMQYCETMSSDNDELAKLLLQQEDMRLSALLFDQTVEMITSKYPQESDGELHAAAFKMKETTEQLKKALDMKSTIMQKVDFLREAALVQAASGNSGDALSEQMLLDLEKVWFSEDEQPAEQQHLHMQLFYRDDVSAA